MRPPANGDLTRDQMKNLQSIQQKIISLRWDNQVLKDRLRGVQKENDELQESLKGKENLEWKVQKLQKENHDFRVALQEDQAQIKQLEDEFDKMAYIRNDAEEALEEAVDALEGYEIQTAALLEKILKLEALLRYYQSTDDAERHNDSGYYSQSECTRSQPKRGEDGRHSEEQIHAHSKALKRRSLQLKASAADLHKLKEESNQRRQGRKLGVMEPVMESVLGPRHQAPPWPTTPMPRVREPSLTRKKAHVQLRPVQTNFEKPRSPLMPPSEQTARPTGLSFKERAANSRTASSSHDGLRSPPSDRASAPRLDSRPPSHEFESTSDRDSYVSWKTGSSTSNRHSAMSEEMAKLARESFVSAVYEEGDTDISALARRGGAMGSNQSEVYFSKAPGGIFNRGRRM